jgi:hypothetical protein
MLSITAEAFLLDCFFHFFLDADRHPQVRSDEDFWADSARSNIEPLQFVGPTSIAFWSKVTWDRFLFAGIERRSCSPGRSLR